MFVSLALWVTLIGRRGRVQTHTMELKVLFRARAGGKTEFPKEFEEIKRQSRWVGKVSSETSTYTLDLILETWYAAG